jgi:hypothetical protein
MIAPLCELHIRDANGNGTTTTISLDAGKVLGRAPGCDVRVDSPSVSGRHAQLREQGGSLEIADLGSSYGTFVGKERVDAWVPLAETEDAWLGDVQLRARLVWSAVPTLIELATATARTAFTLDTDADTLGPRELADFPLLGELLPLVFSRDRGLVVSVVDGSGASHSFESGSLTLNEVVMTLASPGDALASIVAPRPTGGLSPNPIDPRAERSPSDDPRRAVFGAPPTGGDTGPALPLAPVRKGGADWLLVAIGVVALLALGVFVAMIL